MRRSTPAGPPPRRRQHVAGTRPAVEPTPNPEVEVVPAAAAAAAPPAPAAPPVEPVVPVVPVAPVVPAVEVDAPAPVVEQLPVAAPAPAADAGTAPPVAPVEPTPVVLAKPVPVEPAPVAAAPAPVPHPVPTPPVRRRSMGLRSGTTATTAPGATTETAPEVDVPAPPVVPAGRRTGRLVLALAVAVLLGAFAVVASFRPGVAAGDQSNAALTDSAATDEVTAAAVTALQRTYSYSYTTIGADLTAATALMTPDLAAQQQKNAATLTSAITQAKTTAKGQVTADGVRLLQGDRAEVVAFMILTSSNGGTALAPVPLRFQVQMQRVGGTWKLATIDVV